MSKEEQLKKLARQFRSILPVAQDALVNFSPEDRSRLRKLAGHGVIFKLRNVLSALCGEDAHRLMFDRSPELKGAGNNTNSRIRQTAGSLSVEEMKIHRTSHKKATIAKRTNTANLAKLLMAEREGFYYCRYLQVPVNATLPR